MPKVKISEYSATANSNTDVASINIDEGCAPSGINNAIRAVMGHLKDFQQGTYGDPFNGPVNGTLGATTASTASVTTLTTSSTVTHNGGTANGVAYLNGSKVLTTGSALVFDGTNLGVGASSPTRKLDVATAGTSYIRARNTTNSVNVDIFADTASGAIGTQSNHPFYFFTNNAEAGRFDSSGNFLVGTTSGSGSFKVQVKGDFSGTYGHYVGTTTTAGYMMAFYTSSSTQGGYIYVNGSTCSYISNSDYRLKENIQPMTGALAKVQALNPVVYKWKSDGSDGQGFIAHELQAVVPDCVVGEKDAVDADGNPKYQGIDTSFLVATLTAAIQEMKAIIDTQASTITQLQADVAALKGA